MLPQTVASRWLGRHLARGGFFYPSQGGTQPPTLGGERHSLEFDGEKTTALPRGSKPDEATPVRGGHRLGPVAHVELDEKVFQM